MPRRAMTVLMPFHTPFYAPLAAGTALGHFAAEDLDVTAMPAAQFGKNAMDALLAGDIEICLSGLMRSFDVADRSGRIAVHFAEVCSKSGFFLLGREPRPDFEWRELIGRTVLSFAEAPTPWQCMLTVLRRNGVDPAQVRIDRTRPAPEAIAAFRAGQGDFLEQTQPAVEQLVDEGAAHIVASMGIATGPIPFTSYMTTPAFLEREPDVVLRFTRAVYRTQRWLASHGPTDIAEAIASFFPEIDRGMSERIASRFARQDTWARDPLLRRPGYDYLQEVLLNGGFIQRPHAYEDLVDTELARRVMADASR